MTCLFTRSDATPAEIARLHVAVVAAELSLRQALDGGDALSVSSFASLKRLRERVAEGARTLETAFLAREPDAPFADRTDLQRWLRWPEQGQGGDAAPAKPQTRAGAGPLADAASSYGGAWL